MQYQFVYHWQYTPSDEESKVLDAAVALANETAKTDFLQAAACFITTHTGADFTLIGAIQNDNQVNTLAFHSREGPLPNIIYPITGTPCASVFTQRFCYYPMQVQESFPEDEELKKHHLSSYLGSLLVSAEGEPLGLVSIMGKKEIQHPGFAEHLILILSPAIEEELLRPRS